MANGIRRRPSGDRLTQSLQQGFPLGDVVSGADDAIEDYLAEVMSNEPEIINGREVIEGSVPWYMGGPFSGRIPGISTALQSRGGWLDRLLARLPRRPPRWDTPVTSGTGAATTNRPPHFMDRRTDPSGSITGGLRGTQQVVEEQLRRDMARPTGNIITDRLIAADRAAAAARGRGSLAARGSADLEQAATRGFSPYSGVGSRELSRGKYPRPGETPLAPAHWTGNDPLANPFRPFSPPLRRTIPHAPTPPAPRSGALPGLSGPSASSLARRRPLPSRYWEGTRKRK
jgi:hypothetical protein